MPKKQLPDLIDRKGLIEQLSNLTITVTGLRVGKSVLIAIVKEYQRSVLTIIQDAVTIPAAPKVYGRWIDRVAANGQVYCSQCATIEKSTDHNYKSRRCPYCGAYMWGEYEDVN